jgi:hypothetical protein
MQGPMNGETCESRPAHRTSAGVRPRLAAIRAALVAGMLAGAGILTGTPGGVFDPSRKPQRPAYSPESSGTLAAPQHRVRRHLPKADAAGNLAQRVSHHRFPKLANELQGYFPDLGVLAEAADWDVLVVDAELAVNLPEYLGAMGSLRTRNPNLVILTYFSAADFIPGDLATIRAGFAGGLDDGWFMKDTSGHRFTLFQLTPESWTEMLNLTTGVNAFMPAYLQQAVLVTGLTDGIYYDWINDDISWLNHRTDVPCGPPDIDNDGLAEPDAELNTLWKQGTAALLTNSRNAFPAGTIVFGNGGWVTGDTYDALLNGMMIEQFLEGESLGENFGWSAVMRAYADHASGGQQPNLSFVMANRDTRGEFAFMRFALASTLMFDGYFCFTNRSGVYGSAWWYDEYAVNLQIGTAERALDRKGFLGPALGEAFNAFNTQEKLRDALAAGGTRPEQLVWRREFANGVVLVNPSPSSVHVDLAGSLRKILGTADPTFNTGELLSSITLAPRSGVILLR